MAELVDAPASGAGILTGVEVRVFFWAPKQLNVSISYKKLGQFRDKSPTQNWVGDLFNLISNYNYDWCWLICFQSYSRFLKHSYLLTHEQPTKRLPPVVRYIAPTP